MKIETKALKASITRLRKVADRRKPHLPALAWVRFKATKGGMAVRLECTNLELFMQITLDAMAGPTETFTCNLVDLADAVKAAPWAKEMEVKLDSGKQLVNIGGMLIVAQDPSQLPEFNHVDAGNDENLAEPDALRAAVEQVLPSSSNDGTRYNLNSIWVTKLGTGVRLAATDGHRMAMRHVPDLSLGDLGKKGVLVPTGFWKAALPLLKIPQFQGQRYMSFSVEGNLVTLNLPGVKLTARLIDGEAPDMNQVVPKKTHATLTIPRKTWLAEMQRLTKVLKRTGREGHRGLVIEIDGQWAAIFGDPEDCGERRQVATLPVGDITKGWDKKMGFNPMYLRDALAGFTGDDVMINLVDPGAKEKDILAPALIGDGVVNGMSLVMPMRP